MKAVTKKKIPDRNFEWHVSEFVKYPPISDAGFDVGKVSDCTLCRIRRENHRFEYIYPLLIQADRARYKVPTVRTFAIRKQN